MSGGVPAKEYHARTAHSPASVRSGGRGLDFDNKPRPYKVYEDVDRESLPDPGRPEWPATLDALVSSAADASASTLDRSTLSRLCHHAAGVTKRLERGGREVAFRAAACTGALYHVDLYLVCGDLSDLDAGVYHYEPQTHSLDVLRRGDYRGVVREATGRETRSADAPVTVVAASTWWRNAWKYRERTYRHAFWDAGTVLANLLAGATAEGLPANVVTGFVDGRLADLLGTAPEREAPVAAVPLGAGDAPPDAPEVEPLSLSTHPLSPDEKQFSLIVGAYEASTLSDPDAVGEWRAAGVDAASAGGVGSARPGDGDRVSLRPVGSSRASKTPLDLTVRRRGSCREYAREPLSPRKVATVFDRALSGFPMDVRAADGPALQYNDLFLVVNDVADVPQGTYHYVGGRGSESKSEGAGAFELERLREGNFRRRAGQLALDQRLAADAGLCAFFLADLDAVTDRLGDRGYRAAQLEAGLAAGRLYLAAYAHSDLGATGLTFYDDAVTDFFEPRADGRAPTFLWTLGRPA